MLVQTLLNVEVWWRHVISELFDELNNSVLRVPFTPSLRDNVCELIDASVVLEGFRGGPGLQDRSGSDRLLHLQHGTCVLVTEFNGPCFKLFFRGAFDRL